MPAIFLNESDKDILQQLITDFRNKKRNKLRTTPDDGTGYHQSTNIYIGKPATTIPVLTGTSPPVPGSGTVNIYQTIDNAGSPELNAVESFSVEALNISSTDVVPNDWVLVFKDKYGRWIADKPATGSVGTGDTGDTVKLLEVLTAAGAEFTNCLSEVKRTP